MADGTVASWGVYEEGLDTATYLELVAELKDVQKIPIHVPRSIPLVRCEFVAAF